MLALGQSSYMTKKSVINFRYLNCQFMSYKNYCGDGDEGLINKIAVMLKISN